MESATLLIDPPHEQDDLHVVHEHGQEWVTCYACGAVWAIHGSRAELVNEGDESCGD